MYTILMVDDNPSFIAYIKNILASSQTFTIKDVAHNGNEALDYLKNNLYDLLLIDMIMPLKDGISVLETILDRPSLRPHKIMMMSAIGQEALTFKALNLGADYYLMKPIDPDAFISRLTALFEDEVELVSVSAWLHALGLPHHTKGYEYIKVATEITRHDLTYLNKVTTELYPIVAKQCGTSSSRVERAIRNTIQITLEGNRTTALKNLFASVLKDKDHITNSEFIGGIVNAMIQSDAMS